jgi:transposase
LLATPYPLISNDRNLSPAQVLEAHKGQPMIEKRFEQTKTVHEIAPVLLKNEGRIEASLPSIFSHSSCRPSSSASYAWP